jgi:hypothetical protein
VTKDVTPIKIKMTDLEGKELPEPKEGRDKETLATIVDKAKDDCFGAQ